MRAKMRVGSVQVLHRPCKVDILKNSWAQAHSLTLTLLMTYVGHVSLISLGNLTPEFDTLKNPIIRTETDPCPINLTS